MVSDPSGYRWSSYQVHALGKNIKMSTPHREYLALGKTGRIRQDTYRKLFQVHVDDKLVTDIRSAVNKGMAFGNDRFKDEIEALCERRVRSAKMGRPGLQPESE